MEEENGLSLGEIVKIIFKRIWWVLGAMAACVLVFVLVVELWYNKTKEYYSVSYEIVYPDMNSGKYPDGNTFLISDSVSESTLESLVGSDDELKDIDVAHMVQKDRISVAESSTQSVGGEVKRIYTLTVYADYFENDKQAAKFLRAVASYPINRVNSTVGGKDYRPYVNVYDSAKTYEERINALLAQKKYLQDEYEKLISCDQSAQSKLAALDNVFTSAQQQVLEDTIVAKYYVLNPENYEKTVAIRKEALEKQIADNNAVIAAIKEERKGAVNTPGDGQDIIVNPYDTEIAKLTVLNAELRNECNRLDETCKKIDEYTDEKNAANADWISFNELFDSYRNQLIAATDELKEESVRIYMDNSEVIFSSNSIKLSGGMGTIVTAVLGLLVGLILSSVIICIVDIPKYKKKKAEADRSGEPASQENDAEESVAASENGQAE